MSLEVSERHPAGSGVVWPGPFRWLPKLMERYERSQAFGAPAPWRRDVIVKFDPDTFPAAFDPDAPHGADARRTLRDEALALESAGAARLIWRRNAPGELLEVRMGPAEMGRASALARDAGLGLLED
ncbi:MAG: hypothetical protein MN733_40835, partial [Nitrososphaera sp.]|nr:hypothetical protein [Nitrososphaera sp.]